MPKKMWQTLIAICKGIVTVPGITANEQEKLVFKTYILKDWHAKEIINFTLFNIPAIFDYAAIQVQHLDDVHQDNQLIFFYFHLDFLVDIWKSFVPIYPNRFYALQQQS